MDEVRIVDTTLRDGDISLWAYGVTKNKFSDPMFLKRKFSAKIISGKNALERVARRSKWRLGGARGLVYVELYASTGLASARRERPSAILGAAAERGLSQPDRCQILEQSPHRKAHPMRLLPVSKPAVGRPSISAPLLIPPSCMSLHVPCGHGSPHSPPVIWSDHGNQIAPPTGLAEDCPAGFSYAPTRGAHDP